MLCLRPQNADAIAQLMASGELDARNVDRIDTWLTPVQRRNLRFDQPVGAMQARFSLPIARPGCCMAARSGWETSRRSGSPTRSLPASWRGSVSTSRMSRRGRAISSGTEMTAALRTRVTLCDGTILERVVGAPKRAVRTIR